MIEIGIFPMTLSSPDNYTLAGRDDQIEFYDVEVRQVAEDNSGEIDVLVDEQFDDWDSAVTRADFYAEHYGVDWEDHCAS